MNTLTFYRPAIDTITATVDALRASYGERTVTTHAVREHHSHGEGMQDAGLPDVVVFPESNEEIASILKLCNQARIPVIAYGTGTSLEGHLKAIYGGVCLDLSRMAKVLEINAEDMDCRVQAGVTREQLNADIRHTGLFFPIDPGANASIGGMTATRASGTNAVRYGTMRENILGLTVVTPDGRIIRTGTRARKSSAGYDLTRLYIGSEGTLGIITEIQLKLYGVPERISAAVCQFDELPDAVNAVITAMQLSIPMARIELLDSVQMDACIKYSKLEGFEPKATLFMEFHGTDAYVAEQVEQMKAITADFGGSDYRFADKQEDRSKLWKARHDAYWAGMSYTPGKQAFATDSCVPISRLADCIAAAKAEVDQSKLVCMIVGHVGDGNFHVQITFDPNDVDERRRADHAAERIAHIAIAMGGTCTGEHGIGIHKLDALKVEHGEGVDVMRTIKLALDPNNIMNPGKTIPMQ